ncbi:hypothetical protein EVAR_44756_1 [Eumeta japonica]|uniref:Uncharacterized protein n=1 Tax=Eumeta variegata TaxID=151549 RepID=A0A4C1XF70_EUMVA|nr:hypothetical protein EVAR_44756_1 [Eumeta japonica]
MCVSPSGRDSRANEECLVFAKLPKIICENHTLAEYRWFSPVSESSGGSILPPSPHSHLHQPTLPSINIISQSKRLATHWWLH